MVFNLMNQTCKVCGEPAAGFHFGAFTCEGCKSFFGRSYNNVSSISECKNNGKCVIDKKNRTTCKACRLRKCYTVGMSKGGSRYGRRSNWFKIHCLLQEQQQQAVEAAGKAAAAAAAAVGSVSPGSAGAMNFGDLAAAAAAAHQHQQQQQQQHHHHQHQQHQQQQQQQQQQDHPHHPHPHHHHHHRTAAAAAQHLAAAHQMGGLLGYPSGPAMTAEMMQSAAAALPFFSLMSGGPSSGPAGAAFPLAPPHLLFHPGYAAAAAAHPHHAAAAAHHHSAAAAAAAADAAYRAEMFKHRQSVDSAASAESLARSHTSSVASISATAPVHCNDDSAPAKPEHDDDVRMCVGEERSMSQHSISPVSSLHHATHLAHLVHQPHQPHLLQPSHHIHSPIAIRATPKSSAATTPTPTSTPIASHHANASPVPMPMRDTPEPAVNFSVKMQSLSPVSVCSISGETATPMATASMSLAAAAAVDQQDCPMDLSMKTSSRCSVSVHSSGGESADEEHNNNSTTAATLDLQRQMSLRRKFYQLSSENESSDASSDADADRKRQKINGQMPTDAQNSGVPAPVNNSQGPSNSTSSGFNGFGAPTSLRGIFVCV